MNGILAQAAALAAHAKASQVDARSLGDEGYWDRHSTFRFVTTLSPLASGVAEWISGLGDLPPESIRLAPLPMAGDLPPHIAAAFAGPADHGIAVSDRDVWCGSWAVTHRDDPDQRIWSVTYTRTRLATPKRSDPEIERAAAQLCAALESVTAFAASDPGGRPRDCFGHQPWACMSMAPSLLTLVRRLR